MATTTYEPIETYTLGSAASSVTFGSGGTIPQTYTDLVIVSNNKNTANNGDEVGIRFNGDTGNNYSRTRLYGNGSSAASDRSSNTNKGALQINSTSDFTPLIAHVQNYSNSTTYKTVISRGNSGGYVSAYVSLWRNTAAITSITLLPDSGTTFTAGSTFTLYGIANAAIGAPKATGGIITYDNTYYYHTFGASGTFTPQQSLTADILVVAGGGGGGSNYAGAGGAGGVLGFASQSLSATGYTVTVGNGGAGKSGGGDGAQGGNSQFGSLTAAVGGGYGGGYPNAGGNGGSGGGGAYPSGSGGSATSGQGTAGGAASGASGGGGGYGGVGGNGSGSEQGGTGGLSTSSVTNLSSISSWLSATGIGVNGTIAGGGGGSSGASKSGGPGGGGGAGKGADDTGGSNSTAGNGVANTGSGGGGGSRFSGTGGNGGSGVVIVRYLK